MFTEHDLKTSFKDFIKILQIATPIDPPDLIVDNEFGSMAQIANARARAVCLAVLMV